MVNFKIVALFGENGVGKSVIAKYLCDRYGFQLMTIEEMKHEGTITLKSKDIMIVVDGIRSQNDYDFIRGLNGTIIRVVCKDINAVDNVGSTDKIFCDYLISAKKGDLAKLFRETDAIFSCPEEYVYTVPASIFGVEY